MSIEQFAYQEKQTRHIRHIIEGALNDLSEYTTLGKQSLDDIRIAIDNPEYGVRKVRYPLQTTGAAKE